MSSTYWPISLCKYLASFLQHIQSYEDCPILSLKWAIYPNEIFVSKPANKSCFFHSCLRAKNQSQILIHYWNIDDSRIVEPHWLRPIFSYNLRTRFSLSMQFWQKVMQKNLHTNFRFTVIPDKTNSMIFFKSSKTLFLGHIWPFLVIFARWAFFSKKIYSATLNYIWALNIMLNFRKNQWSNSEKIYGQTKDRAERQILLPRTLLAIAGSPTKYHLCLSTTRNK